MDPLHLDCRSLKKAISLVLCASLLWTSGNIADAALEINRPAALTRSAQFELAPPATLGRVADFYNAPSPHPSPEKGEGDHHRIPSPSSGEGGRRPGEGLVILIQDLHAHYGVQKNIAGILDFLTKKKLRFALAVEGASGPIDSSVMALFPDLKIRQDAADYLMREGELTGAEYFAVMHGLPKALTGVEDPRYYNVHRELFRKTLADRQHLVSLLKGIQADLVLLKPRVFSRELKDFQRKLDAYDNGDMGESELVAWLETEARPFGIDLSALQTSLYKHDERLSEDIQSTAHLLKTFKAKTQAEKDLVQVEHDLALLLKVADLQATESEVRNFGPRLNQFVALAKSLTENRVTRSLDNSMTSNPVNQSTSHLDELHLRQLISSSIDYYVMALMRNKPMMENTLKLLTAGDRNGGDPQSRETRNGSDRYPHRTSTPSRHGFPAVADNPPSRNPAVAVLIAGGFHTKPLTQLFRDKNISYLVVTPTVDSLTAADHNLYVKRLSGQLLTPDEILAAASLNKSPLPLWERSPAIRRLAGLFGEVQGEGALAGFLHFSRQKAGLAIGIYGLMLTDDFLTYATGKIGMESPEKLQNLLFKTYQNQPQAFQRAKAWYEKRHTGQATSPSTLVESNAIQLKLDAFKKWSVQNNKRHEYSDIERAVEQAMALRDPAPLRNLILPPALQAQVQPILEEFEKSHTPAPLTEKHGGSSRGEILVRSVMVTAGVTLLGVLLLPIIVTGHVPSIAQSALNHLPNLLFGGLAGSKILMAMAPFGIPGRRRHNDGVTLTYGTATEMPEAGALKQLNRFIQAIRRGKYQDGRVVDLRNLPKDKEVIVIGDVHARLDNIKKILNRNDNLGKIQRGEAVLVFLGDLVHREDAAGLGEMDSSVETMQFVMDLKIQNPDNVYILLGNHDFLNNGIKKGWAPQDALYREKLEELYGRDYVKKYKEFIESSPLMVIGNGFVGIHAGPVKGASYDDIKDVDVRDVPTREQNPILQQATWNRYENGHYTSEDIREFMQAMGQPDAELLVGHSPKRDEGWMWPVTPHHHIIFAGHDRVGYARIKAGQNEFVDATAASSQLELMDHEAEPASSPQRFEIGEEWTENGHRIAGGVSRGRSGNREVIVVDWENDIALQRFYDKILRQVDELQRRKKNLSGEDKGSVLEFVLWAVMQNVEPNLERWQNFSADNAGQDFSIGQVIEEGGVCRHMGILSAAVLERLIEDEVLQGQVFYVRGQGHGWAVYRTSHGEFFVFDAMQQRLRKEGRAQIYTLKDSYHAGGGRYRRYGDPQFFPQARIQSIPLKPAEFRTVLLNQISEVPKHPANEAIKDLRNDAVNQPQERPEADIGFGPGIRVLGQREALADLEAQRARNGDVVIVFSWVHENISDTAHWSRFSYQEAVHGIRSGGIVAVQLKNGTIQIVKNPKAAPHRREIARQSTPQRRIERISPSEFSYSEPIEIDLAQSAKVLEIRSYSDIMKNNPLLAAQLNSEVGYFIVDPNNPRAYKGLRIGEEVIIGREGSDRFKYPNFISRKHVRIKRVSENSFEINDLGSQGGTAVKLTWKSWIAIFEQERGVRLINDDSGFKLKDRITREQAFEGFGRSTIMGDDTETQRGPHTDTVNSMDQQHKRFPTQRGGLDTDIQYMGAGLNPFLELAKLISGKPASTYYQTISGSQGRPRMRTNWAAIWHDLLPDRVARFLNWAGILLYTPREIDDMNRALAQRATDEPGPGPTEQNNAPVGTAPNSSNSSRVREMIERSKTLHREHLARVRDYHGTPVDEPPPTTQSHATSSALVAKMVFDSDGFILPQPTENLNFTGVPFIFLSLEPAMHYAETAVRKYGGRPLVLTFDYAKMEAADIRVSPGNYSVIADPDHPGRVVQAFNWSSGYNETQKAIPLAFLTDESKREVVQALALDFKEANRSFTDVEIRKISTVLALDKEEVERLLKTSPALPSTGNLFEGLGTYETLLEKRGAGPSVDPLLWMQRTIEQNPSEELTQYQTYLKNMTEEELSAEWAKFAEKAPARFVTGFKEKDVLSLREWLRSHKTLVHTLVAVTQTQAVREAAFLAEVFNRWKNLSASSGVPTTLDAVTDIQDALGRLHAPGLELIFYGSFADGRQVMGSDLDITVTPSILSFPGKVKLFSQQLRFYLEQKGYTFRVPSDHVIFAFTTFHLLTLKDVFRHRQRGEFFMKNRYVWVITADSQRRIDLEDPEEARKEELSDEPVPGPIPTVSSPAQKYLTGITGKPVQEFALPVDSRDDSRLYPALIENLEGGAAIALTFNALKNQPDAYVDLRQSLLVLAGTIGMALKPHFNDRDFYFELFELLKNGFVHGNQLDWSAPVYIYLDFPHRQIHVLDTATEQKADPQERAKAREAHLMGRSSGLQLISKMWDVTLNQPEDPLTHRRFGIVSIRPVRKQKPRNKTTPAYAEAAADKPAPDEPGTVPNTPGEPAVKKTISVIRNEVITTAARGESLKADLESCIAVAAFNTRGERVLAHISVGGHGADAQAHLKPLETAKEDYLHRLLFSISGDDWQVLLVPSDQMPHEGESVFINVADIGKYLLGNRVPQRHIRLDLPLGFGEKAKTIILNDQGLAQIIPVRADNSLAQLRTIHLSPAPRSAPGAGPLNWSKPLAVLMMAVSLLAAACVSAVRSGPAAVPQSAASRISVEHIQAALNAGEARYRARMASQINALIQEAATTLAVTRPTQRAQIAAVIETQAAVFAIDAALDDILQQGITTTDRVQDIISVRFKARAKDLTNAYSRVAPLSLAQRLVPLMRKFLRENRFSIPEETPSQTKSSSLNKPEEGPTAKRRKSSRGEILTRAVMITAGVALLAVLLMPMLVTGHIPSIAQSALNQLPSLLFGGAAAGHILTAMAPLGIPTVGAASPLMDPGVRKVLNMLGVFAGNASHETGIPVNDILPIIDHAKRVVELVALVADRRAGITPDEKRAMMLAAAYHDLGKLAPDLLPLFLSPEKFSRNSPEWARMEEHEDIVIPMAEQGNLPVSPFVEQILRFMKTGTLPQGADPRIALLGGLVLGGDIYDAMNDRFRAYQADEVAPGKFINPETISSVFKTRLNGNDPFGLVPFFNALYTGEDSFIQITQQTIPEVAAIAYEQVLNNLSPDQRPWVKGTLRETIIDTYRLHELRIPPEEWPEALQESPPAPGIYHPDYANLLMQFTNALDPKYLDVASAEDALQKLKRLKGADFFWKGQIYLLAEALELARKMADMQNAPKHSFATSVRRSAASLKKVLTIILVAGSTLIAGAHDASAQSNRAPSSPITATTSLAEQRRDYQSHLSMQRQHKSEPTLNEIPASFQPYLDTLDPLALRGLRVLYDIRPDAAIQIMNQRLPIHILHEGVLGDSNTGGIAGKDGIFLKDPSHLRQAKSSEDIDFLVAKSIDHEWLHYLKRKELGSYRYNWSYFSEFGNAREEKQSYVAEDLDARLYNARWGTHFVANISIRISNFTDPSIGPIADGYLRDYLIFAIPWIALHGIVAILFGTGVTRLWRRARLSRSRTEMNRAADIHVAAEGENTPSSMLGMGFLLGTFHPHLHFTVPFMAAIVLAGYLINRNVRQRRLQILESRGLPEAAQAVRAVPRDLPPAHQDPLFERIISFLKMPGLTGQARQIRETLLVPAAFLRSA